MILLPGAGDVRSENRFLVRDLSAAELRVVNADLPGHGSSPPARSYGVAQTADALLGLIDTLGGGPALVVATSFAPAAAIWAAAEHPDRVAAIVAISPHLDADNSFKGRLVTGLVRTLLGGPWAGGVWDRLYRSWYKRRVPDDIDNELTRMKAMLRDPSRRRAVRETLTAHRDGMAERIEKCSCPVLAVFGAADDHFPDPAAEAVRVASRLQGEFLVVEGAGHYPHVERPDIVSPAVAGFLKRHGALGV
ncbi:MAG TPA: alpha/beta hydrolase [Candidatus Krumholzibacteria bacterium]|nr:alpha/beta hydrolase [Candidatus Krumholzibacteria bacterium]